MIERVPIIAIDGPAASGKGTIAKRLASELAFAYLDTGVLYRKTAFLVLEAGGDPDDEDDARTGAILVGEIHVPDYALRTAKVGSAAAKVAAIPVVRQTLLSYQREFAANPPAVHHDGVSRGAVLDGRDIGTVVCPDADVKLFVTAKSEIRAARRFRELRAKGTDGTITFEDVLKDIRIRDERDRNRAVAPLRQAPDAHLLDTSDLDIEAAYAAAAAIVYKALNP